MSQNMPAVEAQKQGGNGQAAQKRGRLMFRGAGQSYCYLPKDDITAVELAEVVELLQMVQMVLMRIAPPVGIDSLYNEMSHGAKRHFQTYETYSSLLLPPSARGH